jgi:hypothetical protein
MTRQECDVTGQLAAAPAVLLIEDHPKDRLAIRLHLEVVGSLFKTRLHPLR